MTPEAWADALKIVIKQAFGDPVFHEKCKAEPEAAFEQAAGVALPEEKRGEFLDAIHALETGELSEAKLDQVAGGSIENPPPQGLF